MMIKQLLLIFLLLFIVSSAIFYFFQRSFIYFPLKSKPDPQFFLASDMQEVGFKTQDGLWLNAWYKPAVGKNPTILYCHGNAGNMGYRMPLVRAFLDAGFGVLLFDYRGYGGNYGRPNENGFYQDGRAAVRFLQQQGLKKQQLVFYGESLGTAVATKMAVEYPACALVLQSPFTSLAALARHHYPWALLKPWDKFDSLSRIKMIHTPLFVLQGENDVVVPYHLAASLFDQANEPKQMINYKNRGHNDLWTEEFAQDVIHFIGVNCGSNQRSGL